jgi:hypothetical protein
MPLAVRAAVDAVAAEDRDSDGRAGPPAGGAPCQGLAPDRFHTECW